MTDPPERRTQLRSRQTAAGRPTGSSPTWRRGRRGVVVDSPPGAGKSTLVVGAAAELASGTESGS